MKERKITITSNDFIIHDIEKNKDFSNSEINIFKADEITKDFFENKSIKKIYKNSKLNI